MSEDAVFQGNRTHVPTCAGQQPVHGSSARSDNFETKFTLGGKGCGALSPSRPQKSARTARTAAYCVWKKRGLGLLGLLGRLGVDRAVELIGGNPRRDAFLRRREPGLAAALGTLRRGRGGEPLEV